MRRLVRDWKLIVRYGWHRLSLSLQGIGCNPSVAKYLSFVHFTIIIVSKLHGTILASEVGRRRQVGAISQNRRAKKCLVAWGVTVRVSFVLPTNESMLDYLLEQTASYN